jgi:phosphatidylcholine synthase
MSRLTWSSGRLAVVRAYVVHFYTSLGLIAALLAMIAAAEGRPRDVFIFLGLALWIDSTDGTLARGWEVKVWTPRFDGRKLDDIIDYMTYTFIPVFFAYKFGVVTPAMIPVLVIVLMASAYGFCQQAAKTDDGYFTGFPSYWNIAIFYMYVLHGNPVVHALILLALAIMVFIPVKYIYPSQTPILRHVNVAISGFWFVCYCIIVATLPNPDPRIIYVSLLYPTYYMGMSFYLHFSPRVSSWLGASRVGGD